MERQTQQVDAWDVTEAEPGRDWASWLARALLALYLLPALLAALAVGGLALILGALARGLQILGGGLHPLLYARSAAPGGRRSVQGCHLGGHSRSTALGRSGHEAQPWR